MVSLLTVAPPVTPNLTVNEVVPDALTYICLLAALAPPGVTIIALGVPPKDLLKVTTVSQVPPVIVPVPVTMVNDPAESVDPELTVAVGLVPQLAGAVHTPVLALQGRFVCVILKWALLRVSEANVVVVPLMVITEPDVSIASRVVPAAFWTWKAVVESAVFLNSALPLSVKLPVIDISFQNCELFWTFSTPRILTLPAVKLLATLLLFKVVPPPVRSIAPVNLMREVEAYWTVLVGEPPEALSPPTT